MSRLPDESCRYSPEVATDEAVAWITAGAHRRPLAFLLPRLEAHGVQSVFEYGYGSGLLASALPAGLLYVGVDACAALKQKAESLCAGREKCRFFVGDVRKFPFPDDTPYDLSMAWSFMKHFALDEWDQILAKVLSAGRFGAFDAQVAPRDFDDGTRFPHAFVTAERVRAAVGAAGHEVVAEEQFSEWRVGEVPCRCVAYWTRRRAAEGVATPPEAAPPAASECQHLSQTGGGGGTHMQCTACGAMVPRRPKPAAPVYDDGLEIIDTAEAAPRPPAFDRSRLTVRPATGRKSSVRLADAPKGPGGVPAWAEPEGFAAAVRWLRERPGPRLWFLGGHVFKANVGWYLRGLLRGGWVGHLAVTGAGLVHDWELSHLGHTGEDVPAAIRDGSFGMWEEIGRLNEAVSRGWLGLRRGAAASAAAYSCGVLAAAAAAGVPATAHVAVGQDVFFQHPNCDGAAWGGASYADFLTLAAAVAGMQGGTYLSFGSAVASPEVFLKALAMARNAGGGRPDDIAVAVFDRVRPPADLGDRYFHRPAKTLLGRVAAQSVFVHGRHEETIPNLWKALCAGGGEGAGA